MDIVHRRTHLPVLLLYNLDPSWASADIEVLLCEVDKLGSAMRKEGHPVMDAPVYDADLKSLLSKYRTEDYIVFNWCDEIPGLPHSESLVAHTLGSLNYSYTGSPPDVLALSWDKSKVKCLLDQHHVPTPRWWIYESARIDGWDCYPAIVKPAGEHCSFGVTTDAVVLNPDELRNRIGYVLDVFHQPALVEDFIDGREFHISLWGNGAVQMLPAAEMDFTAFDNVRDRLCTFDSKFSPDSIHYNKIQLRLPAPLTESEYRSLEQTARTAYRVIGCRDYARIDIRLKDGTFYVLDVNPNADISSETSMASSTETAGYSYGEMASVLVNLAAQRHPIFGLKPP